MYKLPLKIELYDIETLKILSDANNKIGGLKGVINQLPNPEIILNAITLGEAKSSSEIESIITTYDELYKEMASTRLKELAKNNFLDIKIIGKETIYTNKRLMRLMENW